MKTGTPNLFLLCSLSLVVILSVTTSLNYFPNASAEVITYYGDDFTIQHEDWMDVSYPDAKSTRFYGNLETGDLFLNVKFYDGDKSSMTDKKAGEVISEMASSLHGNVISPQNPYGITVIDGKKSYQYQITNMKIQGYQCTGVITLVPDYGGNWLIIGATCGINNQAWLTDLITFTNSFHSLIEPPVSTPPPYVPSTPSYIPPPITPSETPITYQGDNFTIELNDWMEQVPTILPNEKARFSGSLLANTIAFSVGFIPQNIKISDSDGQYMARQALEGMNLQVVTQSSD